MRGLLGRPEAASQRGMAERAKERKRKSAGVSHTPVEEVRVFACMCVGVWAAGGAAADELLRHTHQLAASVFCVFPPTHLNLHFPSCPPGGPTSCCRRCYFRKEIFTLLVVKKKRRKSTTLLVSSTMFSWVKVQFFVFLLIVAALLCWPVVK